MMDTTIKTDPDKCTLALPANLRQIGRQASVFLIVGLICLLCFALINDGYWNYTTGHELYAGGHLCSQVAETSSERDIVKELYHTGLSLNKQVTWPGMVITSCAGSVLFASLQPVELDGRTFITGFTCAFLSTIMFQTFYKAHSGYPRERHVESLWCAFNRLQERANVVVK